ncbi:MAG: ATP-dependent zinc metalloprotease FtsH [Desulfobulbaceae bacterium]|nr:ATP-dependent zinc metalloprotease FtsH [Desulfobulbaceae bacterium]
MLCGIWYFFIRKGGLGKAKAFGQLQAQVVDADRSNVSFKDVAGIDEAKEELVEIVNFLKNPDKYTIAGARIPTGVLLYGEPGTGKTLLAKAIAGEAGVTFFSISGSNFVEMYAGIGASRVRDLFIQGKKKAPCIIFIDEIDAVGKRRGGGSNDEREQTLNQLLVEMDGFQANDKVIIVAATNRLDTLDPALLRPGRFDRQVLVPLPDVLGREHIIKVHAEKVQTDESVDWHQIAKETPGFSGAELANLVNEATLMAVKGGGKIGMVELELAKDKVMMGAERRSMIISEKDKEITAYHEIGHALVALMTPGADPVVKVSIIPRGESMGQTMQVPDMDKHSHSCAYLFDKICVLLGGRIAEELIYEELTTGSANDIERATGLARRMVCEWGMHEKIGPVVYNNMDHPGMIGPAISEQTAVMIDEAVKDIIQRAYDYAKKILLENTLLLNGLTQELLDKETISAADIERVMGHRRGLSCHSV